jgi:hypothetical protein
MIPSPHRIREFSSKMPRHDLLQVLNAAIPRRTMTIRAPLGATQKEPDRSPGPIQARFWLEWVEEPFGCAENPFHPRMAQRKPGYIVLTDSSQSRSSGLD